MTSASVEPNFVVCPRFGGETTVTVSWTTVNAAAVGVLLIVDGGLDFRGDGGPRGSVPVTIPCNGKQQHLVVKASREANQTSATGPAVDVFVNEGLEGT